MVRTYGLVILLVISNIAYADDAQENLKTCLTGLSPYSCKKHLLTEAEKAQVVKAEKSYTTQSKTQYRNTTTPRTYYYSSGLTFHGYDCTVDCSGHEAGYEWAEDNDINDVYDCDGNSDSFNEGCEAYVEENY